MKLIEIIDYMAEIDDCWQYFYNFKGEIKRERENYWYTLQFS